MVHVFMAYFTPEVIDEIRSSSLYFKLETWKQYHDYHIHYQQIPKEDTICLMNEFRHVCETIAVLPKAYLTSGN